MKKYGHLPNVSNQLGKHWCGNGDLEGTVLFSDQEITPTNGPVITGAIKYRFKNYPDGYPHSCVIQDAGIPPFVAWYLAGKLPSPKSFFKTIKYGISLITNFFKKIFFIKNRRQDINVGHRLSQLLDEDDQLRHTLPLLGMGRDRSDGQILLQDDDKPIIKWNLNNSELHYERVRGRMKDIAKHLGGQYMENPLSEFKKIIAVHPLGGCKIADSSSEGVIDTRGEVFGHPGLFVADASIMPTSLGPNPSLTIAAMAEYFASQVPSKENIK